MKSLLVTLLIIGALFLGYDFYVAPPHDRMVFERPAGQPAATAPAATPLVSKKDATPPQDRAPEPAPTASTAPVSGTPDATRPAPKPETTKPSQRAFVPPRFDSIEVVTGSWQKIPATAFPRAVKLLRDTTFKFSVGSSVVRSGAAVVAMKMDNGQLIVAPNEGSPARQAVPVDDTDLKGTLVQLYEKWKTDRIEEARRSFEEELRHPKPAADDEGPAVDSSGKPLAAANGTYPVLLAQLRKGIPSEITPANIIRWREPVPGTYKGNPIWTIEVSYKTMTMFGEMNVDSLAHVQNGRVVDWVFKGSGEPVP